MFISFCKIGDLEHVKFYSDVLLSLGLNSEHVLAEVTDILAFVNRVFDKSKEILSGEVGVAGGKQKAVFECYARYFPPFLLFFHSRMMNDYIYFDSFIF